MISVSQLNTSDHPNHTCLFCEQPAKVVVSVTRMSFARRSYENKDHYCRDCARDLSEKLKAYHDNER